MVAAVFGDPAGEEDKDDGFVVLKPSTTELFRLLARRSGYPTGVEGVLGVLLPSFDVVVGSGC